MLPVAFLCQIRWVRRWHLQLLFSLAPHSEKGDSSASTIWCLSMHVVDSFSPDTSLLHLWV